MLTNILKSDRKKVWTLGYGGRSREEVAEILKRLRIEVLIDVRRFPRSKIMDFNGEVMRDWLRDLGVNYVRMGEELGGFVRGGYSKYTETETFRRGIQKLTQFIKDFRVVIMCMEKKPRYCHRRFITKALQEEGFEVIDIT